jgi:hypothetical protein
MELRIKEDGPSTYSEILVPLIYENLYDVEVHWTDEQRTVLVSFFKENTDLGVQNYGDLKKQIKRNLQKYFKEFMTWQEIASNTNRLKEDYSGHLSAASQHLVLAGTEDSKGKDADTLGLYVACEFLARKLRQTCAGSIIKVVLGVQRGSPIDLTETPAKKKRKEPMEIIDLTEEPQILGQYYRTPMGSVGVVIATSNDQVKMRMVSNQRIETHALSSLVFVPSGGGGGGGPP